MFKIMKDRLWRQIRILTAHFHAYDADGKQIKTPNIQQTVNQAFEKCQELLDQWEVEMTKQSQYEAAVQRLDKNYVDDLLREVTEDFHHFTVRIADCSVMLDKCTRDEIEDDQPRVHAVIEGDIEPGILTYERKNDILVMPNPSQTPLMVIKVRGRNNGEETQALGMPDTGSHRNLCSESFARNHGLEVDKKEKTNLKAANGQHLSCIGATKANVSYHGVQLLLTIYVMKDVPNKYVIISKDACQGFGILSKQFPLPLRLCESPREESPNTKKNGAETRNRPDVNRGQNKRKQNANRYAKEDGRTHKMAKTGSEGTTDQPNGNVKINIKLSLNNDENRSVICERMNKTLKPYFYVYDITARKQIKVPKAKLRFRKDIKIVPSKCTSSKPIPYALRQAAKKEIAEQMNLGIIARVPPEAEIEWCSKGMILEKPNGGRDVRLVVDAKEINEVLERDPYPMQSTKELLKQIPPSAKYFLSVDFYKGYYQIPLAEEDQLKTTFMLHGMGLYYFKRLPQGGKCSVDQFNRITDELVLDIPNCLKIVDDVMFYGSTVDEVLEGLTRLMEKCRKQDFTLHPNKVSFGNRIRFAGHIVSEKGITIDPRKVEAIRGFKPPENVTDMKAFVGVAVQFQEACPNLMGVLKPLIETTSHRITPAKDEKGKTIKNPNRKIIWNENLEEAFWEAKRLLTNADGTVLTPFNPKLPLVIYTDASRLNGYGWIAIQEVNGKKKLIECGSCTINDSTKRNFSVSELELAAVEMALRKMRLMTVANENIIVKTDHLPLLGILKKPLEKIETKRLMKLAEKLQDYTFKLEYIEGSRNDVADAFSRNPINQPDETELNIDNRLMVNLVSEFRGHDMCSMAELKEMATRDNDYQQIRKAIEEGVIAKNLPPTHPGRTYKADWNLLAISEDLITLGDRILVPKGARKDILREESR